MLFSTITLLAAEEGVEESEGIDLLLPATSELIAGAIAFAIIFLVVWKFALPRLSERLEARQDAITGQLTDAEKAKVEAESLLGDYRKQLDEARTEANQIVEEARQSAETVKAEIVAKADAEAAEITRKAREEAASEKERAAAQIRDEVASLSLDVAQKVVAGSVDDAAQRALVDRYLAELEGMGA